MPVSSPSIAGVTRRLRAAGGVFRRRRLRAFSSIAPAKSPSHTTLPSLLPRIFLVTVAGSKKLVFKRLDDDCLLDGHLHPAIRQRLNRIRELPLGSVANLIGVERVDGVAQLLWEF